MVSFRKKWRGGIKSPPVGFFSAKSFCFPAGKFQPKSAPLPPALCREIAPKRRGGRERGIGDPPLGEQRSGSGRRPGRVPVFVSRGEPGPVGASPPAPHSPSRPPPRCRSPGRWGCRTPQFQRGKRILLLTDPASKNKNRLKPNRGKDFVFFFPLCLSCGAEAPQSFTRCPPEPPKPTSRRPQRPDFCRADSSLLTICFSLGKVSGAILWPTHRGYICSKCWVASAG